MFLLVLSVALMLNLKDATPPFECYATCPEAALTKVANLAGTSMLKLIMLLLAAGSKNF